MTCEGEPILNIVEPMTSSTNEPMTNMIVSNIKYLSQKIKRKKKWLDGENHIVAVSEPQNSKNKYISKGENLSKELEDEVLGSFPSYFKERSSILIEPM